MRFDQILFDIIKIYRMNKSQKNFIKNYQKVNLSRKESKNEEGIVMVDSISDWYSNGDKFLTYWV